MTSLLLFLLAVTLTDNEADRKLALKIMQNDAGAFREFYEKYQGRLFSFLMSKGLNRDDAEDLIQGTFLVIWGKRKEINPDRSLRSYLFTIAYNRMLNHFRDQKAGEPEFAYQLIDTGQNPADAAQTNQTMYVFQKALASLPEKRRRVFELCYLEELSYREAAEALSINRKTVENHMALALKDLRVALKNYLPDHDG